MYNIRAHNIINIYTSPGPIFLPVAFLTGLFVNTLYRATGAGLSAVSLPGS